MKKIILSVCCIILSLAAGAQAVQDSVRTGTGIKNQVWYSLENGVVDSSAKNNWDIAFDMSSMGMTILTNTASGTTLALYPNADTSAWSSMDTTGFSTWPKRWNADTSWGSGAFERYLNPSNAFDAGWGQYNNLTHSVTGDSLFVIKLADGSFRKIWIVLLAGGNYTFRYAQLDGGADTTVVISKSTYSGKNFVYYSLQNNEILNREPTSSSWDLVFGSYTTFIPDAYPVSGVLSNKGVLCAKVTEVANAETFADWNGQTFSKHINVIGYDWKKYSNGAYEIADSLVYFVKDKQASIWKLIFTGFGGSANGKMFFTKEKLSATAIADQQKNLMQFSLFPNPASEGQVQLVYSLEQPTAASVQIFDLSGKEVFSTRLMTSAGLHTSNLNLSLLNSGLYIVSIQANGIRAQQKLMIK